MLYTTLLASCKLYAVIIQSCPAWKFLLYELCGKSCALSPGHRREEPRNASSLRHVLSIPLVTYAKYVLFDSTSHAVPYESPGNLERRKMFVRNTSHPMYYSTQIRRAHNKTANARASRLGWHHFPGSVPVHTHVKVPDLGDQHNCVPPKTLHKYL